MLQESLGLASPLDPVEESGDALLFRRPAISEQVFRRLRRGQYRVEAEIDLHGLTAPQAEPALRGFPRRGAAPRARVVRVIHGKGLRSGNRGPVLKLVASSYLQRVGAVLAFASAREVDGGSGAILVLLERQAAPAHRGAAPDQAFAGGSWSPGTQKPCTCGAARYGSFTVAIGPSSMCCASTISRSERPFSC